MLLKARADVKATTIHGQTAEVLAATAEIRALLQGMRGEVAAIADMMAAVGAGGK